MNPMHALEFFAEHPGVAFAVFGAVFLTVTGGEALYSDLGHFGRRPIALAWFVLVWPCLLLNYFGQGALLLRHPQAIVNPFYLLAPSGRCMPLVVLATAASIIASQAVISGVFAITQQCQRLGYIPRVRILHSSASGDRAGLRAGGELADLHRDHRTAWDSALRRASLTPMVSAFPARCSSTPC